MVNSSGGLSRRCLSPWSRREIVERVLAGTPQATVAEQMGVSRATVSKWVRRWREEGDAGLADRSSRPLRCPRRTPARVEEQILGLRRRRRWGPVRIGARLGVPASTVHRVLVRHGLNRLSWMDRPTGRVIRRYERPHPGDLVHLDVKKVARVPPGGGWRAHGRGNAPPRGSKRRPRVGYSYLHVAIDDHSRLAYVEALDNETADTLVGFFDRARIWFRGIGVAIDEIITDNGPNFRSKKFADQLARRAIPHIFTRPYRPQTNGKAERFNRTLTDEFLYNHKFRSEPDRRRRLDRWTHDYNLHRHHTAIDGTPASRVHNLYGHYT